MQKQEEIKMMQKLYKEYQQNVVAIAVKGEYIRTVNKRQRGKEHDCAVVASYYNIGTEHCGKRIFKDYAKPFSFEYLVFEHPVSSAFVKVFVDTGKTGKKIYKIYDFTILKGDKITSKKLLAKDFDILGDEDRNLILLTENCFELISRCELAQYNEIVDQDEKEDLN